MKFNIFNFHKKKRPESNYEYFGAISDMLYYAIKNQNEKIAKTISDFMYGEFQKIRNESADKEVVYPNSYYEVIYQAIEELASQKNKRLSFLEHRTAGSVWLLGEFGNSKISENSYSWIWRNILLALKYDRDDYIIYHWENAYQYASYSLQYISVEYSETFQITNQAAIDQRQVERKRFLEFHYALGGLLLYKGCYNGINRMFSYTQSIPPRYELLPGHMTEVFNLYFNFRDPYEMYHPWISSKYPFPGLGGLDSDGTIKNWICKYIALLFIRQYSIVPYLIIMKPLDTPAIPQAQAEKRQWIDNLDHFKNLVQEILQNRELLTAVGLDFITDEWCEKHERPKPLAFIEKVKQDVIASFENTLIEQPISDAKVQAFKNATAVTLTPIFDRYKLINNALPITGESNKWYVNGESAIIDKSGFAENQDADHLNFDSFLPTSFSQKYKRAISETFVHASSQRFIFNSGDIVSAITRLGINSKDYIIVSFGVDVEELILEDDGESIRNITIVKFDYRNYPLVGDSIFILKIIDLPKLTYKEINQVLVAQYSLERVNDEYNLYATVIDLNDNPDVQAVLVEEPGERDLRKSVYMAIYINLEIQWKKGIECIQITRTSPFRERGIVSKLGDVKPFGG